MQLHATLYPLGLHTPLCYLLAHPHLPPQLPLTCGDILLKLDHAHGVDDVFVKHSVAQTYQGNAAHKDRDAAAHQYASKWAHVHVYGLGC